MNNTNTRRLLRTLPVVFLLASAFAAPALAQFKGSQTTPGGDGPGDVRGHIDIPEIGFSSPGTDPTDLFDFGIDVDDDEWGRIPATPVTQPEPGMGLPPGSWNYQAGTDLFAPTPVGSWERLDVLSPSISSPGFTAPPAVWAPTSTVPTPGVGALFATALASLAGRRRRRSA